MELKLLGVVLLLTNWSSSFSKTIQPSLPDKSKYIIDNAKCKMPQTDVCNEEIAKLVTPRNYTACKNYPLSSKVTKINNTLAELQIQANSHYRLNAENLKCSFSHVSWAWSSEQPDHFELSSFKEFDHSLPIKIETNDPISVKCVNEATNETDYENVHNPVLMTDNVTEKFRRIPENQEPISVLFVVFDSVARMNLIRTMKSTYEFLMANGFTEMKGYNKVNDHTIPNFSALLTGLNFSQFKETCDPKSLDGLTNCPMIWYDYRDLGYATAYAEDDYEINTFNPSPYKGFSKPPTDYYYRPYVGATEKLHIEPLEGAPYCTGPETSGERILRIVEDFAYTFKESPSFGMFWMNTFSHNELNLPFGMDEKVKEFFQSLKEKSILDKSIVIFLADHGMRFGAIRETKTGWFEERLPMNLISIPKWFQDKFPTEYDNFKENANKLTSTYDMFMTLQHILTLSGQNHTVRQSKACDSCQSLFKPMPESRSCQEAGISSEWCTCIGYLQDVNLTNPLIKNATNLALEHINHDMTINSRGRCHNLTLDYVVKAAVSEDVDYTKSKTVFLVIETVRKIKLLATVVVKEIATAENMVDIYIGYGKDRSPSTSPCVQENYLEHFCECKSTNVNTFEHHTYSLTYFYRILGL